MSSFKLSIVLNRLYMQREIRHLRKLQKKRFTVVRQMRIDFLHRHLKFSYML